MAGLSLRHIYKKYPGGVVAVSDFNLEIKDKEFLIFVGPSGCGKSTTLRMIAGLEDISKGEFYIDGKYANEMRPRERGVAMVFQSYALWPHMTLAENVAFGLKMRKVPADEIKRRVAEALDIVKMGDRAERKPNQLSGGQQQRVALARALVVQPRCLLLDEPLSNLDAKLRLEMRIEIRRICKEAGLTAVYVTHDQKEALSIADRLAIMRDGVIEQIGTPLEVFRKPTNSFVASFIGETNFLPPSFFGAAFAPKADTKHLSVRPETIRFDKLNADDIELKGTIHGTVYLGETAQHQMDVAGADGSTSTLKVFQLNPEILARDEAREVTAWVSPKDIVELNS